MREQFQSLPKHAQDLQIVLMMRVEPSCSQRREDVRDGDHSCHTSHDHDDSCNTCCPTSDDEGVCAILAAEESCPTRADEEGCPTSDDDEGCPTSDDGGVCPTSHALAPPAKRRRTSGDEDCPSSSAGAALEKRRRAYKQQRSPVLGSRFLGEPICKHALKTFLGLGWSRIRRVMLGHLDLRTISVKGQHGQSLKKTRKDGIFNNVMDFFGCCDAVRRKHCQTSSA